MAKAFEKANDHFTCDLCQERYKEPKAMDCLHSFCQTCLEDYYISRYKDAPKFPCPVCRQETVLPDTRIQGLKTNFHLMEITEEVSQLVKVAHLKDETKCHKHKGEGKHFYCETCQELICRDCRVTVDHRKPEHHSMDSKEASLKYKQSLMRDMLPDLTTDIKRLEQSLAASSQAQQRFTENVTMTVKAVQDRAAKMRAEITSQEKKLIGEINQTQQDRNRMFEEHQKTISTMLQGKQNSLVMAKEITYTASEHDFLSLYPIISKDLISLKRLNPPKIDPELSYLSFTPDPRIDKLNLGKIKLKIDKWDKRHEFGKQGSSRGKFDMARGIAAAQMGDVAVADCWNKRVVICDNEGQHKKYIPLQSRPWDIATIHNHDNQLVVVDDTKYVKVFDKKNKLAFQFPTVPQSEVDKTEVNLCSVAVRKDGTILVGDVERMVWTEHRPTDGQLLHTVPVQTPPYFLAVDDCSDRVVVCGSNKQKVDIASSNGRILASIKPTISGPPVMNCFGVCCSSSEIYIAVCNEPGTGHIHHYDLDGIFLTCLAQGLYSPRGITFTSDEQLAVADKYSVKRYHKVGCHPRHQTRFEAFQGGGSR